MNYTQLEDVLTAEKSTDWNNEWDNGPYVARYILNNGKNQRCSLDEYREWQRQHPGLWLIRTAVLNGCVETVFDGEDSDGETFVTYRVDGSARESLSTGGGPLYMAGNDHAEAVHNTLKDWFAASSFPNAPRPSMIHPGQALRGISTTSNLYVETLDDSPWVESTPLEAAPERWDSLRYRLMRALAYKPLTWYELVEKLVTEEARLLRSLERAWNDGLLVRLEGQTSAEPPRFQLSPKGWHFFHAGRLSLAAQGGSTVWEDRWVLAENEPWRRYHCPLCGGPAKMAGGTQRVMEIECCRNPGWSRAPVRCVAYWQGIIYYDRLVREMVGKGDVRIELDHRVRMSRVYIGQEIQASVAGVIPPSKLLSKLQTYVLFS